MWGIGTVAGTTSLSWLVAGYLRLSELVMINLLAVVAVSTQFGIWPSLFTAALMSLSFDFFFIPPTFALTPSNLESGITLAVMVVVAGVISGLMERTRRQQLATREKEVQIETERLRNSLLSAVSHDLRTPLASIVGAGTELLQDGASLDHRTRDELARSIVEEAERLNQLVSNLLDMARLGARVQLHKRPEPLDEIIETTLERLRGRLRDRQVHTSVPAEVPLVPMDPVLIGQLFFNLVENAIRYTPASSPIDIDVAREQGSVIVEVADRGPGIREARAERLFERFYRGEGRVGGDGGVGLGLTICRAIVEAHAGKIGISNRSGGGALVRVELPLSEQAVAK